MHLLFVSRLLHLNLGVVREVRLQLMRDFKHEPDSTKKEQKMLLKYRCFETSTVIMLMNPMRHAGENRRLHAQSTYR